MWLRGCVRCGGDVFLENSPGSVDVVCLQCGCRQIAKLSMAAGKGRGEPKKLSGDKKVGVAARRAA